MNNLAICKRIAEIEGRLVSNYKLCTDDVWVHTCDSRESSVTLYNPLTDDALWFGLVEKYEVSISFVFCKVLIMLNGVHEMNFTDKASLRRSVLLLIIKAHKETNNESPG